MVTKKKTETKTATKAITKVLARTPTKVEVARPAKSFYLKNVNMSASFDGLKEMAAKLGVRFQNGDILICDNVNCDRRKTIRVTPQGSFIEYAVLDKKKFAPMAKISDRPLNIKYFEAKQIVEK
jgi:hypothetical protein